MDRNLTKRIFNNPKNRELIEQNNWEEFYDKITIGRGAISEFLLNIGINPLFYMTRVPEWFAHGSNIKSIDIPDSIKSIDVYAFSLCTELASIIISDSVTSIWKYAFYDCTNLKDITYKGTISQWNKIVKQLDWNKGVPKSCLIHCTDGDIKI